MVAMFEIKSKVQNYPGYFSSIGLSPFNTAMGIGGGQGINTGGSGIEQYPETTIGKSPNLVSGGGNLTEETKQTRRRAKRANEIFRIISKSVGLRPFFFDKFLVWSDFVEGKLNEEDFIERVREEFQRKAESLEN
jgi:hypothetical protein